LARNDGLGGGAVLTHESFAAAIGRVYRSQQKKTARRDAGTTMSGANEEKNVRTAAVFTADHPRRRTAQPHRGAADASIFRDQGISDRLASDECRKIRGGRRGARGRRVHKVERRGCGTVGDLGIWDDKFVEPLARLVKFIKQQNAVAGIQLGHSGRKARATRPWEGDRPLQRTPEIDDWDEWTPVAPSAIAHSEKWPVPRALERHEVKDLVQAWGNAAWRADAAGFDVLELHGAHGYLVHEFLSEKSNQRSDEYGGSEQNRMRFITEVTEAVRGHWPDHKPLFVRLSVEDNAGWGPEQSARLATILKGKGVDVIDCSSGGITDVAPILGKEIKYSYQVPLSEYVKRHADIMTMAVGLIIHGDQAEQILQDKQADLIAVGREILNNPNWPMDAALKLGVEGPFRNVPPQFGYWLGTRAKRGFGTQPSTWQNGLDDTGKVL
jgi:2,4-dienoyl-CoA reductase-like NADH-dependent reductase (Old Yellow Enzyme family)